MLWISNEKTKKNLQKVFVFPLNDLVSNAQRLFAIQCHVQLNCWSRGTNREIASKIVLIQVRVHHKALIFIFSSFFLFNICFASCPMSNRISKRNYSEKSQRKLNAYRTTRNIALQISVHMCHLCLSTGYYNEVDTALIPNLLLSPYEPKNITVSSFQNSIDFSSCA